MLRIFVIDDNADNLIAMEALLGDFFPEAEVVTFDSPIKALEEINNNLPDVVLVDYYMPEMNGNDFCVRIKNNPETSFIPVILITAANTTSKLRASALESGADAFVTKPIDEVELVAELKAMIRIKKAEDSLKEANKKLAELLSEKSERLREKEINYQSLFNSINDIVIIHDLEGMILEVNERACEYFGLKDEDLIGRSVLTLFNYQRITDIASNIMSFSSIDRKIIETTIKNAEGEIVPVEVSSRLVEYNNDYAILSLFKDVREKHDSTELKRLISLLIEDSDDAVVGLTLGGEIVSWNHSAERIFGYRADEIIGSLYSKLIPPHQHDFFPYLLERIRHGEKIDHYETEGLSKNGEVLYLTLKIVPIRDSLGDIIGASIIERDVTQEQRAIEKIRKGKDFLKNLDEINPAFYVAINSSGNILSMNRAMLFSLGYSLSEVVGKNYIDLLFSESDRQLQRQDFLKIVNKKKVVVVETTLLTRNGEEIMVEWHGKPVLKVNGQVDFIFFVGIDITERKRLEKAVMETNAAERLKIGQDLHDRLAQHLAGITFRGELLKLKIGDAMPDVISDVDEIINMVNMAVNKTREIAKELCPVEIGDGGLLTAVENLKDEIGENHNVNILIRWDKNLNLSGKLELSNLYYIIRESIYNSIEVNRAKNIIIASSKDGNLGVIEIIDDGLSFDSIDKEKNSLFQSMLKYRSWLMGASSEIRSNPAGGAIVSCRFKLTGESLQEDVAKWPSKKKIRGKVKYRVLLVDSHPVVRQGLRQILEIENDLEVVGETGNAEEALKLIGRLRPEIMVTDISLSGTGGLELIKACKERYPTLPILVLSIYEESIYAERSIRAGARGYVMKDESPAVIVNAIRTVLDGRQYMSDNLKERLLDKLSSPSKDEKTALVDSLTDREFEVFQLIGHGLGNKHIADKLHISVKTVENYREKIKTRLNIDSSSELVQFAVQWILSKTS
ncbi:MAG TPA: PAS domain S-box protein [Spirochaetota bacterium]|nr:PAS domain S-box protein [Spirochaetota bacterium]